MNMNLAGKIRAASTCNLSHNNECFRDFEVTVHTLFRHLLPEQGQRMLLARHPAIRRRRTSHAQGQTLGWMPLQFAAGLLFGQV